jgi:hypothetical protein
VRCLTIAVNLGVGTVVLRVGAAQGLRGLHVGFSEAMGEGRPGEAGPASGEIGGGVEFGFGR